MRNTILKIVLKLSNKDIFKEYNKLKKIERNSLENNLKIQEIRLKRILLHAYRNVPYYHNVLGKAKVVVGGKINLDNFNKIPILTKEIIRREGKNLYSRDCKKRNSYENTSGGSTGEPVKFLQDRRYWIGTMAGAWFQNSFVDNYPCKQLKLWGSERDILQGGYGIKGVFKNWVYSRKYLNAFKMSEENMKNYIQEINLYKPIIIEAYVQSIYEMSKFARENKLNVYSPKGIIVSAGTLYPEMKKLIEDVFGCPIFNRYGSREVGDMACSCDKDEGLHLSIFSNYVEILDKKLKPCKPREIGKVYVTMLNNYSMPLIRYDIGDVAVPSKKQKCSCGRGLPLIESVRGRDVNLFKTRKGDLVDGEYFTHLFYLKNWVERFQVVQKDYDLIEIKIVGNKDKKEMKKIERGIKVAMGKDCKIKWEFVLEIKPTKSGKYLYTVSEIK